MYKTIRAMEEEIDRTRVEADVNIIATYRANINTVSGVSTCARWKVSWKDDIGRNIRLAPLDRKLSAECDSVVPSSEPFCRQRRRERLTDYQVKTRRRARLKVRARRDWSRRALYRSRYW
jgi:hypothetical protein